MNISLALSAMRNACIGVLLLLTVSLIRSSLRCLSASRLTWKPMESGINQTRILKSLLRHQSSARLLSKSTTLRLSPLILELIPLKILVQVNPRSANDPRLHRGNSSARMMVQLSLNEMGRLITGAISTLNPIPAFRVCGLFTNLKIINTGVVEHRQRSHRSLPHHRPRLLHLPAFGWIPVSFRRFHRELISLNSWMASTKMERS